MYLIYQCVNRFSFLTHTPTSLTHTPTCIIYNNNLSLKNLYILAKPKLLKGYHKKVCEVSYVIITHVITCITVDSNAKKLHGCDILM